MVDLAFLQCAYVAPWCRAVFWICSGATEANAIAAPAVVMTPGFFSAGKPTAGISGASALR